MFLYMTLAILISTSNYFAQSSSIRDSAVLLQRQFKDANKKEETQVMSPENGLSVKNEARDLLDKRTAYFTSSDLTSLQNSLTSLTNHHTSLERNKVVFSAQLNTMVRYSSNQIFLFDDVTHRNYGGTYGTDGKFSCPVTSNYFVSFTLRSDSMTKSDRDIEGQVVKESFDFRTFTTTVNVIASAKAKNQEENGDSRGGQYVAADVSCNVIVRCQFADTLYIRAGSGGSPRVDFGEFTVFKFRG